MQISRLMGSTAAAPTATGSATTVESADYVMLHNSGTTLRLVTLQTAADGTTLATMQLSGGDRVIIKKDPSEVLFAAHAEVLLTNVDPMVVN